MPLFRRATEPDPVDEEHAVLTHLPLAGGDFDGGEALLYTRGPDAGDGA